MDFLYNMLTFQCGLKETVFLGLMQSDIVSNSSKTNLQTMKYDFKIAVIKDIGLFIQSDVTTELFHFAKTYRLKL